MVNLDIAKYRRSAEDFLSSMDREYYLHFSGKKKNLEVETIYSSNQWLFSRQNIDYFVRKISKDCDRKKHSYLLKFCAENFLEKNVQKLKEEIANREAGCRVEVDGRTVPLRYLEILVSNEPDKGKRDRIEDLRNEKIADILNPMLVKYWTNLHREAKLLGFDSYSRLFSYLKGQDFNVIFSDMKELLSQTQDVYEDNFGRLLKGELGLDFSHARRSDFSYLKRGREYDQYFRKERIVDAFSETLKQMGIDIYKQKNINLDIEERKNKSPRAFCCTVGIPQEIYLVIMPNGGQDDYEALFHEGGHAQHFAHTSANLDFEFRFLGDNAVTEGHAFLLENLLENKSWLTGFTGMGQDTAARFSYFNSLLKLWYCRRYAGKLEYELKLHGESGIEGRDKDYVRILSESNLMQYPAENYLKDVDEGFYCTNYIRAWMFEAQLSEYMVKKFGYSWHSKQKAGNFLKEVWSYGQKYDIDEIVAQLDFKKLDASYLISSLKENILNYRKL
ncbi:MAG: hypothetical protein ACQEP5_05540 [Actinomycetota bacterium]